MLKFFITALMLTSTLCGCATKPDSVSQAIQKSDDRAERSLNDAKFLIEMSDARMMDYQEGKLAAERGTKSAVRSYGRLMEKDQTALLEELKAIAHEENITLPNQISDEKSGALTGLQQTHGKKFDDKFAYMITIDHKRDVKEFTKTAVEDGQNSARVKNFATLKLPLIQSHLEKIERISSR